MDKEVPNVKSIEDFMELSNGELMYYLRQRGLPITGNHGTLSARALIAFEQKASIIITAEKLNEALRKDYQTILTTYNIPGDPCDFIEWNDDMKKWPKTNIGQIFIFFKKKKAFSSEYIGQYKVRKAYTYFKSGFVDKILISILDEELVFAKTFVMPSQRLNNEKHSLWILFKNNGDIVTSYCSCTAGLSQCCNHVAAALYKIEFANEKSLTDPACTEKECEWNAAIREIAPMKIKHMDIREHNKEKFMKSQEQKKPSTPLNYTEKQNFDPRPEHDRNVTDERKEELLHKVREILPNAVAKIICSLVHVVL